MRLIFVSSQRSGTGLLRWFINLRDGTLVWRGTKNSYHLKLPWNEPLFSERNGYAKPIFRFCAFRLFKGKQIFIKQEKLMHVKIWLTHDEVRKAIADYVIANNGTTCNAQDITLFVKHEGESGSYVPGFVEARIETDNKG